MKLGDIVVIKENGVKGKVIEIDDWDVVTVLLDNGDHVMVMYHNLTVIHEEE